MRMAFKMVRLWTLKKKGIAEMRQAFIRNVHTIFEAFFLSFALRL
jgi:hypothetical protein